MFLYSGSRFAQRFSEVVVVTDLRSSTSVSCHAQPSSRIAKREVWCWSENVTGYNTEVTLPVKWISGGHAPEAPLVDAQRVYLAGPGLALARLEHKGVVPAVAGCS